MNVLPDGEMRYGVGKNNMESLMIVVGCLLFGMVIHSMIHRYLRRRHAVSMRATLVYMYMCIPLLIGLVYVQSNLIISSIVLYICMVSLLSFLYVGVVLGGETPSSMILHALSARKHMTQEEITGLFSEEVLVWKRIEDLKHSGLISMTNGTVRATDKGQRLVSYISIYERLFHRRHGG